MTDNQTNSLFIESIEEALKETIRLMGGAKTVGAMMRPEKLAVDAGTWLSDCLNPEKRDKLSLEQVMWILREARKAGVHTAMNYIAGESGYSNPAPVEPEDERAKLQRDFIESTKTLARMAQRIEQLTGAPLKASV